MKRVKRTGQFAEKHGKSRSSEYLSWVSMRQRCLRPDSKHQKYKEVKICDRWIDSFANFYKDMGDKPTTKHTIERIDNLKGYEPSNCRWATRKEQNRNYSQNRSLTFNGETMCVTEWAEKFGIDRHRIYQRLNKGWSIEKSLTYNRSL